MDKKIFITSCDKFSEDIDIALDREYLGFKGELTKADLRRLKRESFRFISTNFIEELKFRFLDKGFANVQIQCREVENHDQDPLVIEIYYPKLTETDPYLKPGLLVEIGSRSLKEPFTLRSFTTMVSDSFPDKPFYFPPITIPSVNPERTFLEKIFLLHEEFQRPKEKIRINRLSRHLYDIGKLMQTPFAQLAIDGEGLYNTIVNHRIIFNHISGVDPAKYRPALIQFIPPSGLMPLW